MYSKVILIGRLTRDPEIRYAPSGTAIANFTVAVNHKYKQGGEAKDDVAFVDIVTFGKLSEFCGQYLNKGTAVIVDGRLSQRRWESEGTKRSKIEVVASTVDFLPGQKRREDNGEGYTGEGEVGPVDETGDLQPF